MGGGIFFWERLRREAAGVPAEALGRQNEPREREDRELKQSERDEPFYFTLGDYAAGAAGGVLVAAAVRGVVSPAWDMVAAMMVGMVVGLVAATVAGLFFAPLLGMFETMVPGMLIGMYGGMLFAMRDSMEGEATRLPGALLVGAALGAAVVACIRLLNACLRGVVYERPRGPGEEGR